MNTVVISGNVVAEIPELRDAGEHKVVDIRVAVRGRGKDDTTFIDVTLWNKTAETAKKFLDKGKFVIIEGRLQEDSWEDKETGQKRSKIKIVANGLDLGPKVDSSAPQNEAASDGGGGDTDDEVPF